MLKLAVALLMLGATLCAHATVPLPRTNDTNDVRIEEWLDLIDRHGPVREDSRHVLHGLDSEIERQRDILERISLTATSVSNTEAERALANIDRLLQARRYLFENATTHLTDDLLSFGQLGQTSMKFEMGTMSTVSAVRWKLNAHYLWDVDEGFRIDGARQLNIVFHALILLFGIAYWKRTVIPSLTRAVLHQSRGDRARRSDMYWLLLKSRGPWSWLAVVLFISYSIDVNLPQIDIALMAHPIISALMTVGIGSLIYHLGSVQYQRNGAQDPTLIKRAVTIQLLFAALAIGMAALSALTATGLTAMTLYSWVMSSTVLSITVIALLFSLLWRQRNLKTIQRREYRQSWCFKFVQRHRSSVYLPLQAVILACFLSFQWFMRSIVAMLTASETIRAWFGIFFKKMVQESEAVDTALKPIDESDRQRFYQGPETTLLTYEPIRNALFDVATSHQSTIAMIYGQRAMGKTRLIKEILVSAQSTSTQGNSVQSIYVECPDGGFSQLTSVLAETLGFESDQVAEAVSQLRADNPVLIAVDNVHRLITPALDGLNEFERLLRLIRRSSDSVSWLLSMDMACWRYFSRARGERYRFDIELPLGGWSEDSLRELIEATVASLNIKLDFSSVQLPRQPDEFVQLTEAEQKTARYFRVLSQHARGNPGFALMYFARSIYKPRPQSDADFRVGMFDLSLHGRLDTIGIQKLLILRAVAQMGRAEKSRIEIVTQSPSGEVTDSLRHLRNIGVIRRRDNALYEITWDWYPEVLEVLHRKHLLQLYGRELR